MTIRSSREGRPTAAAPVAGIVLAGGRSRRMGRDKALLPYGESTFVETMLSKMRAAGIDPVIVVASYNLQRIAQHTHLPAERLVVQSNNFVRTGLETIEKLGDFPTVVLCPVDIPAIQVETLRSLVARAVETRASVVVPRYRRRLAATLVVFSSDFLPFAKRLGVFLFRSSWLSWSLLSLSMLILIACGRCRLITQPTEDPSVQKSLNTPSEHARATGSDSSVDH